MAKKKIADSGPAAPSAANPREQKAHTAPSVRVFTQWTPDMLRSAEQMAEVGNLRLAVTLCEWLLTDDRVPATLDARIDALLGLEPTFEPGKGRKSRRVVKALEAGEDFWEAYPESELRQMLRWGILLGGSLHRHNWTERKDHGGRLLPMPRFWHPQTLNWNWQLRQLTVYDANYQELVVTVNTGEWIFHTPGGFERFWANGVWRSLSRWVLLKAYAMGDWSRHAAGGTRLVALAPDGATSEQRAELARQLASDNSAFVLANGFTIEMLEAKADTKAIYQAQVDAADSAIAILIRGGNLTTKIEGNGSNAAAKTQADIGDGAKKRFDAASLSTTLNGQSLSWWAELNYGDPSLAPWPTWPVETEEDKSQRASMVKTLGEGLVLFDQLGYEIKDKELAEDFGIDFLGPRTKPEPIDVPVPDGSATAPVADGPAKKPAKQLAVPKMAADTGHIDGQLYVDDVVDDGRARVGRKLKATLLADLLEAIRDAKDYEGIRSAVLAKYRETASPSEVRDMVRAALVMGELAGNLSVTQDL